MYYHIGIYIQDQKFDKFFNIHYNGNSLRRHSVTSFLKVICKDFVNVSYRNASFCILENYIAAGYLFLNDNCILICEIVAFNQWAHSTDCQLKISYYA